MFKLLHKIDIRHIFTGHIDTFVDESTGAKLWSDFVLFYASPIVLSVVLYAQGVILSDTALDISTNALAILAGLLFNLLVLLHSLSWPKGTHPLQETAHRLSVQVYANIAYCIVSSLVALIAVIIAANTNSCSKSRLIISAVSAYLIAHFGLTMVMVLKRIYVVLQDDFSSRDE